VNPAPFEATAAQLDDGVRVVAVRGELDLSTTSDLEGPLEEAIASGDASVLIDLSGCEFIDSTVIAALLEKFEDLRREGYRLELLVPPEQKNVRRVIEVIGLGTLIAVHDAIPRAGGPGLADGAAFGA
jgi:anti-anti-sigma factor